VHGFGSPCSFKISDDYLLTEVCQKVEERMIFLQRSMASWKDNLKFLVGTHFLFRMLLFTAGEDGDPELQAQGHDEWRLTSIDFEFPQGLTNSTTA
jgi:hypothetical protein